MITMTEIARLTGVSQPTVSRVLNGNTSVDPEIAKKVLQCAKEHNYQPNLIAQSLVGNKTFLIGLVVTDISNPFFAEIAKAVEAEASRRGYSIMLFNSDYQMDKEEKYLELLNRYRVDGVILTPILWTDEYIDTRLKYSLPLVGITLDLKRIDSVYVSHYDAGKEVGKHLVENECENFTFIGGINDEKEIGYRAYLESTGIDLGKHYYYIEGKNDLYVKKQLSRFIEERLDSGKIGIFACNDIHAIKVIEILKELKIRIPQDVALVGFDNTYFCKFTTPALTSIAQPVEEIGRIAVDRLIEKINSKKKLPCKRFQLGTELVVRSSSIKPEEEIKA